MLAGYRLDSTAGKAVQQWALAFPGPTDSILKIAVKDPAEHVYSYAKVRSPWALASLPCMFACKQ